jgi:N-acetylmuramoyl-L-alanine amidase
MSDCFEGCSDNCTGGRCVGFDDADVHSLALCAWKEARGEGCSGMRAVMHVIVNRVNSSGFARNVHDVIYGKNQFTSMSVASDPEFNLQPADDDHLFISAVKMAVPILQGQDFDITNGACWYANLANVTSGWFLNVIVRNQSMHPVVAKIGKHTFFK